MKNKIALITLVVFVFGLGILNAQEASSFTKANGNTSHRLDTTDFVTNEILVKFKDEVEVTPDKLMNYSLASKGVNSILEENNIKTAEKLFPGAQMHKGVKTVKTPLGKDMVIPNLHNIYRIVLGGNKSSGLNPFELKALINQLKTLPEVEYAEPNYYYSIGDFKPVSPVMNQMEAMKWADSHQSKGGSGLVPNDPLYSQQWGIPAIHADQVWNTFTGDTSVIIAILDTGVDWHHPDLAENIWINPGEIPGNGRDDDGNGFIDDVRGWDFINNDNDPMDDNSHGTHCAGIAAAAGNNGIGIAGVNWKAKIMPIKVFQSDGWGDAATISKGINYAAQNGAKVISMSFGGYGESQTMRIALANAYATAVLVAAAGNDGLCIGPGKCPDDKIGQPLFPGAYSFVLGVQAPPLPADGGFTNYDQDGPVFSNYPDQYNYELSAPGTGIISCVPGGNYRIASGTSMATPFVAGAVSLYRELKPKDGQEIMWGNLINSSSEYIDINGALNIVSIPVINITNFVMSDTMPGDDRDGKADAGETIQLEVFVHNTWGPADSVYVGIQFAEFEDTTTATILQKQAFVGSIGAYGTLSNHLNLLEIKISPNIANGRDIRFVLKTWQGKNHLYQTSVPAIINVTHGTELKGILDDTLRLTSDKFWLVDNSFKIGPNGVLIIEPGTTLEIEKQITNLGEIFAFGKADSIVTIIGPYGITGGFISCQYTHFESFYCAPFFTSSTANFEYCRFENAQNIICFQATDANFLHCELLNLTSNYWGTFYGGNLTFKYINFYNNNTGPFIASSSWEFTYCNFANSPGTSLYESGNCNISYCNYLSICKNFYYTATGLYSFLPNIYWEL